MRRTTTRSTGCLRISDPLDLRIEQLDPNSILDTLEEQIQERQQIIEFLEDQIRAWSRHPSASTWSQPQKDSD